MKSRNHNPGLELSPSSAPCMPRAVTLVILRLLCLPLMWLSVWRDAVNKEIDKGNKLTFTGNQDTVSRFLRKKKKIRVYVIILILSDQDNAVKLLN